MSGGRADAGGGVRSLRQRAWRSGVLVLAAVSVLAAVPSHVLPAVTGTASLGGSLGTSGLLFTVVGAVVVLRQPQHRLGPLLVAIGALGTLGGLSEAVTSVTYGTGQLDVPGAHWAGWFGEWYWVALLWLQLVALPLLFPDGRLPSPRWRWFARAALVVGACQVLIALGSQELMLDAVQLAEQQDATREVWLDSPVGFLPVRNFELELGQTMAFVAVFVLGAMWSLITRSRHAEVVARRQVTVAVAGVGVNALGFVVFGVLDAVFGIQQDLVLLEFGLFLIIPVTLGVAILRYRLYEIDRIVSRTMSWAVVSLLLVGLYLGAVVALQATLRPVLGEGDLPVALATLAVAAVARPLLRRVQALVDRRFNRARVDAARTIEAFGRDLRDEVSRDAIVADLRGAAHRTFQPTAVGVHLVSGATERTRS